MVSKESESGMLDSGRWILTTRSRGCMGTVLVGNDTFYES